MTKNNVTAFTLQLCRSGQAPLDRRIPLDFRIILSFLDEIKRISRPLQDCYSEVYRFNCSWSMQLDKPQKSPQVKECGASLIGAAIVIPVITILAVIVFDLARIYVNSIYAREIALLAAKISNSRDPEGYAFLDSELPLMKNYPAGEAAGITSKRQNFWDNQLDSTHSDFWGLDYFPSKDKKVLNLAYRFALDLNPRMYFPIPEPLSASDPSSELGHRVNCSIEIDFASGHTPPAQASWPAPGNALNSILNAQRDRVVNVTCAVPLIGIQLSGFSDGKVFYVRASAYAFEAGNIRP